MLLASFSDRFGCTRRVGDIAANSDTSHGASDFLSLLEVQIQDGDLSSGARERPSRCGSQARGPPGYDGCLSVKFQFP